MLVWYEIALRLFLACVLGGLVGIERERKEWTAGLRTHMMVCMGSALFMMVSAFGFEDIRGQEGVGLDPSRIAAQVVSGIGFLGAGTILFLRGEVVKGLTTAAGLWTVAGIGLAIGGGMYVAAGIATVLVLIILALVRPYKNKIVRSISTKNIRIKATDVFDIGDLQKALQAIPAQYSNLTIEHSPDKKTNIINLYFSRKTGLDILTKVNAAVKEIEGVTDVKLASD